MAKIKETAPPGEDQLLKKEPPKIDRNTSGQAYMATKFYYAARRSLMYVHRFGWMRWDGKRWVEDEDGHATMRAFARVRTAVGAKGFDQGDQQAIGAAKSCMSTGASEGSLKQARTYMSRPIDSLDRDEMLLNVDNGTLNLRTLHLRPHTREDGITKICNAGYDPKAKGERWERFLDEVLPDLEERRYLQKFVGQALIGKTQEHLMMILLGSGRNGKGVLYQAISYALGDYASQAPARLFTDAEEASRTGAVDLQGRRWVVVSETERNEYLAQASMKRLTGGDPVVARRMGKDYVRFDASHSCVMVTNHLPRVQGDDPAVWERIRVVEFSQVIPAERRDPNLPKELEGEAEAVLLWAIEGLRMYQAEGMSNVPDSIRQRVAKYRVQEDDLKSFLTEFYEPEEGGRGVPLRDLFQKYSEEGGGEYKTPQAFSRELQRRNYTVYAGAKNKRYVKGLKPIEE